MNRFWLQQYPDGVPADVDVHQHSSLIELFEESFTMFADRNAVSVWTRRSLWRIEEMSAAIGAYLKAWAREGRPRCGHDAKRSAKSVVLTAGLRGVIR